MRPAMMPRVKDSPNRERENRTYEDRAEGALTQKKLDDEKNERAEKHQAPAQPMGRPPGLWILERPGGANSDEVVRTQVTEVISENEEEDEQAGHEDAASRDLLA
jgi:hypothetical protein